MPVQLGIEIGGTKLQLGVGDGLSGRLLNLERFEVRRADGAQGILQQIATAAPALIQQHHPTSIGIGFGGPVRAGEGRVVKSHQVDGWDDFPLAQWAGDAFRLPVRVGNDCNLAALAEARFGAGQPFGRVLYVTVGTGIGGGLVIDGKIDAEQSVAAMEIGHLRPGCDARDPQQTVESLASGLGIARQVAQRIMQPTDPDEEPARADLRARCGQQPQRLTTKVIAEAAREGNPLATEVLEQAAQVLGWALAQVVTLVAPQLIVIGGGVALMGDSFLEPVKRELLRYVFPPLRDAWQLVPAQLGEDVVIYGALALAASVARHSVS